jgi:hypothetical protein
LSPPSSWQQSYLAMTDNYFRDYTGEPEALHEAAKKFTIVKVVKVKGDRPQFIWFFI